jgi:hypothetical protein
VAVVSFTFDFAWMHEQETSLDVGSSINSRDLNNSTLTVSQDFLSIGITWDF